MDSWKFPVSLSIHQKSVPHLWKVHAEEHHRHTRTNDGQRSICGVSSVQVRHSSNFGEGECSTRNVPSKVRTLSVLGHAGGGQLQQFAIRR